MNWDYAQSTGSMVGLQNLGEEGWQAYIEERSERGPIEAEVNEIPDAEVRRLYEMLKEHFEG